MNCSHCGQPASSHDLERAFGLPDAIFALSKEDRERRAVVGDDLCMLDREHFFLRGVLYLPIRDTLRAFGIGFWVKTDEKTFDWYVEHYKDNISNEPPVEATLANAFKRRLYAPTVGVTVLIQWGPATNRPTFRVMDVGHELYGEQARGITLERSHELLALPS